MISCVLRTTTTVSVAVFIVFGYSPTAEIWIGKFSIVTSARVNRWGRSNKRISIDYYYLEKLLYNH